MIIFLVMKKAVLYIPLLKEIKCGLHKFFYFTSNNKVSLLEKAWAKLFTNYENIEFGVAREALHAFTGAPTEYFFNRNNVLNDE